MPSKKVKNAKSCKICLKNVTPKTGVQCQGACKKWVHFKCLCYTPGKILDIKKGYLSIKCPCPDCQSCKKKEKQVKCDQFPCCDESNCVPSLGFTVDCCCPDDCCPCVEEYKFCTEQNEKLKECFKNEPKSFTPPCQVKGSFNTNGPCCGQQIAEPRQRQEIRKCCDQQESEASGCQKQTKETTNPKHKQITSKIEKYVQCECDQLIPEDNLKSNKLRDPVRHESNANQEKLPPYIMETLKCPCPLQLKILENLCQSLEKHAAGCSMHRRSMPQNCSKCLAFTLRTPTIKITTPHSETQSPDKNRILKVKIKVKHPKTKKMPKLKGTNANKKTAREIDSGQPPETTCCVEPDEMSPNSLTIIVSSEEHAKKIVGDLPKHLIASATNESNANIDLCEVPKFTCLEFSQNMPSHYQNVHPKLYKNCSTETRHALRTPELKVPKSLPLSDHSIKCSRQSSSEMKNIKLCKSDSCMVQSSLEYRKNILNAIEQLYESVCPTIGKVQNQFQEILTKMKNVFEES